MNISNNKRLKRHSLYNTINEDAESKGQKRMRQALITYGVPEQKVEAIYRNLLLSIPNIRGPYYLNSNGTKKGLYKWAPGVIRMKYDKELEESGRVVGTDKMLKFLSDNPDLGAKYDDNLNDKHYEELFSELNPLILKQYDEMVDRINSHNFDEKSSYTVVKVPNFYIARKYAKYMEKENRWCITISPISYNGYTQMGTGLFYFFLKHGFENVPKQVGDGCPLDEYGLSMIAVSVTESGEIKTITTRWNHTNEGTDNAMTPEELSHIVNMNVFKVCKPYTKEELGDRFMRTPEECLEALKKGNDFNKVFENYCVNNDNSNIICAKVGRWAFTYDILNKVYERVGRYNRFVASNVTVHNASGVIPEMEYYNCVNFINVDIGDEIKVIDESAFNNCVNMRSIKLPDSIEEISTGAFFKCKALERVSVPDKVMELYEHTFGNCNALKEIDFGSGVKIIHNSAFRGCISLSNVIIPENVEMIEDNAFIECPRLKTVYIKSRNTKISPLAFSKRVNIIYEDMMDSDSTDKNAVVSEGANGLNPIIPEGISCPPDNEIWYSTTDGNIINPYNINAFGANVVSNTYTDGKGIITFDGNVIRIGTSAFFICAGLTSITIPDSVTSIGRNAFYRCTCLTSINIPGRVTNIEGSAFENCIGLTTITIPDNVMSIGIAAFLYCKAISIIRILVLHDLNENINALTDTFRQYCPNADIFAQVSVDANGNIRKNALE